MANPKNKTKFVNPAGPHPVSALSQLADALVGPTPKEAKPYAPNDPENPNPPAYGENLFAPPGHWDAETKAVRAWQDFISHDHIGKPGGRMGK